MFAFDRWVQPAHLEILKDYSRRPKAEATVVLCNDSHDRSDTKEKHV